MKSGKQNHSNRKAAESQPWPMPSAALRQELHSFIEYHPSKRFSRNLRSMLLDFLMSDGAIEASYLKDLLFDLEALFRLLDLLETESDRQPG